MPRSRIRPARTEDVPEIFSMVCELAEYERARDQVQSTEELFRQALFCEEPAVWCSILEHQTDDHPDDTGWVVAGMAIWFQNFFTWTAKHSLYLDDLYVREQYRGLGYGKALLAHLAQICVDRGYPRLDWWVLDWNPAIDFYRRIGAVGMDEWTVHRLSGEPLHRLARGQFDDSGDPEAV
jgi:GNAT superfamily N-acetyltransferase